MTLEQSQASQESTVSIKSQHRLQPSYARFLVFLLAIFSIYSTIVHLMMIADNPSKEIVVVTAASDNHFGALKYLLNSAKRLQTTLYFYDLGLTEEQLRIVKKMAWPGLNIRNFD